MDFLGEELTIEFFCVKCLHLKISVCQILGKTGNLESGFLINLSFFKAFWTLKISGQFSWQQRTGNTLFFLVYKFLPTLLCLHFLWQFFGLLRYLPHYWLIGIECIRGLFDVLKWLVRAGYMAILRYMSNFSWQLGGTISYHRLSNKITVGGFLEDNNSHGSTYILALSTGYSISFIHVFFMISDRQLNPLNITSTY